MTIKADDIRAAFRTLRCAVRDAKIAADLRTRGRRSGKDGAATWASLSSEERGAKVREDSRELNAIRAIVGGVIADALEIQAEAADEIQDDSATVHANN